jgi:hypothetical protein
VRGEARNLLIQDYDLTDLCSKKTPTNTERALFPPTKPGYRQPDVAIRITYSENDEQVLEFAKRTFGDGCSIAKVTPLSPIEVDYTLMSSSTGVTCRAESGTTLLRLNTVSKYAMALITRPPFFFDENGTPKGGEVLPSFRCYPPSPPRDS